MPNTDAELSTIVSELDSAQFEGFALDADSTDPSSTTPAPDPNRPRYTRKTKPNKRRARDVWSYARLAKPGEPVLDKHQHRLWYCKQDGCDWRTGTLRNARIHLQRQHNIISFEEPSKSAKVLNRTLEKVFARQGLMDPASY